MAKAKKTPLKEFDAGVLINPYLCKTRMKGKGVKDKGMITLTFKGINMGTHVGYKK